MNLLSPQTQARVEQVVSDLRLAGAHVRILRTDLANDECTLLVMGPDGEMFALRVSEMLLRDRSRPSG